MEEVTKYDIFAAVEEGDIATLERYFAQPGALQAAVQVEALLTNDAICEPNFDSVARSRIPVHAWVYLHDHVRDPFYVAVSSNQLHVLQWLLESSTLSVLPRTRLVFLARAGCEAISKSYFDLLEYLLTSPAFTDHSHPEAARENLLALLLGHAIGSSSEQAIDILLAHGADVNMASTEWRESPLTKAATQDTMGSLVTCLLRNGASILGGMAVHRAVEYGCSDAAKIMVEHGVDPRYVNDSGETVLHRAAQEGFYQTIEALLTLEAIDLDYQNHEGDTALALAIKENPFEPEDTQEDLEEECVFHPKAIQILLQYGADTSLVCAEYTALGWAVTMGNLPVIRMLVQHGADLKPTFVVVDLVGSWLEFEELPVQIIHLWKELELALEMEMEKEGVDGPKENRDKHQIIDDVENAMLLYLTNTEDEVG